MRPVAFLAFFSVCLALLATLARAEPGHCAGPGWIYFDIGNTLVDTHDWDHIHYFPETVAYLAQARAMGYRLGLITNVPESWGKDAAEKITRLKSELKAGWQGDPAGFDWAAFDDVIVPLTDAERKPAPTLYERAMSHQPNCPKFYEGEDPEEIRVADHIGLESYLVNSPGLPFYMPLPKPPAGAPVTR